MKVLIIEDEHFAAIKLSKTLGQLRPNIEIIGLIGSVIEAISWLSKNPSPDLIFLDIQLGDGTSFEIFEEIQIPVPVIFITAFDNYVMKAFDLNSIDYILKPFSTKDIERAIKKYETISQSYAVPDLSSLIIDLNDKIGKNYKSRFFITKGQNVYTVAVVDISYIESSNGMTSIVDSKGIQYVVEYSLDQLESLLDPALFFRASRQILVHVKGIHRMHTNGKGRIQVYLNGANPAPFMISRARTRDFKNWLDGLY